MSYKKQKFILILFIIITAMSFYWYGCSQEWDKEDVTYSLVKSDRGEYIILSEGRRMAQIPGALKGFIDELKTDDEGHVYIFRWAFDAKNSRLPDVILVSHNGKILFRGQNSTIE